MVNENTITKINEFLQSELIKKQMIEITAIEAGKWLQNAKLLNDSKSRRGKPLRDLLRANKINGQIQIPNQPNGRWFIRRKKISILQKIILFFKHI